MVLLHRLSSLKYNHPEYDFGEALILTPNEQFSLHIKGLAEGLQIGFINRISVEEYYIQILRDYAISFVPQNTVSSEVFVNQAFVDYVYSDVFKSDFDSAYEKVMSDRQDAFAMLKDLCDELSEDYPASFGHIDSEYMPVVNHAIRRISLKVEAKDREINEAEEQYKNTEKKLKDAQERLPKVEHLAKTAISEVIPKVYTKLGSYLSSLQHSIEEQQAIINNAAEEASRVERQFFLFGKRDKLVFNVYGDVNQLLKPGRGISNWTELEKEFSMKEFQLNENYRNTNQITRFCNSSFEMDVMQTGVDGAKVREIPRRELEKELADLKLGSEKIAVLVPRSVRRKNYLATDILPDEIRNAIGQKIDNGLISFMYVDEVKGIEFDKVFVVSNKMTKNEKYIAYTRALSELVIVVDENIIEQGVAQED